MKKLLTYILTSIIIVTAAATSTAMADNILIAADDDKYSISPIPLPDGLPGIDPSEQQDVENGKLKTRNILTERVLPRFALGTIGVVGGLSIVFLIIGGVRFATAYGREESIESAKKQVTWSIVGFLIALLSYTIVSVIINLEFKSEKNHDDDFCIETSGKPCDAL